MAKDILYLYPYFGIGDANKMISAGLRYRLELRNKSFPPQFQNRRNNVTRITSRGGHLLVSTKVGDRNVAVSMVEILKFQIIMTCIYTPIQYILNG